MTTFDWINVMGLPHTVIEATVRDEHVLVDRETRQRMADTARAGQLTTESDAFADAILSLPVDPKTGLIDVTEFGGGFECWMDVAAPRRKYVDGCYGCTLVENRGFGPKHDASPRCESGGHPHCTCDTCF